MEQTAAQTARNVRGALAHKSISQDAAAAHLGMSRSAFGRRMTGEIPFDVVDIAKLAALLDVGSRDLIPDTAPIPNTA